MLLCDDQRCNSRGPSGARAAVRCPRSQRCSGSALSGCPTESARTRACAILRECPQKKHTHTPHTHTHTHTPHTHTYIHTHTHAEQNGREEGGHPCGTLLGLARERSFRLPPWGFPHGRTHSWVHNEGAKGEGRRASIRENQNPPVNSASRATKSHWPMASVIQGSSLSKLSLVTSITAMCYNVRTKQKRKKDFSTFI